MTIVCNKLSDVKPEQPKVSDLTTEQKLDKLRLMYHIGVAAQKADPEGMKLVSDLMLGFNLSKQEKNDLIQKIRKHFGIKTEAERKRDAQKALKRFNNRAKEDALRTTCVDCFHKIGYKRFYDRFSNQRNSGITFTPECGRGKDLTFMSWQDAADWLKKAEFWDEKEYQKYLQYKNDMRDSFLRL